MEQQKLPNATTSLVLGILSFVCCCFSAGVGGAIMSIIALVLANKDNKLYLENPEGYSNYSQLKAARVIAIIGLVLGILTIGLVGFQISAAGGWDAYMEQTREVYRQMGIELD